MSLRDQLLDEAERFCREHNLSEARLATIVVNDGKFFTRVRGGGQFTTATYEKFQRHFAANKTSRKAS